MIDEVRLPRLLCGMFSTSDDRSAGSIDRGVSALVYDSFVRERAVTIGKALQSILIYVGVHIGHL